MSQKSGPSRATYHGKEYLVVLGPAYYVEQHNGALLGSGMPTINLADPSTGELCVGLTVEIPEAPLKPGQVLVGGKAEGLRALTEAGAVRFTGRYYRSEEYAATFAVCDLLIGQDCQPKHNAMAEYPAASGSKLTLAVLRNERMQEVSFPGNGRPGSDKDRER